MADLNCDPVPPGAAPVLPADECPPCPDPILAEKASASGPTPICYPDGSMVYAVANSLQPINDVCPRVPGTPPAWVGYWDQTGAWTDGNPPSGWVPCGAKSDVELAGRVCLFDTTTNQYAGSLFVEAVYDNSVTPPLFVSYVLAALLPDGTWQRPFVPAPNLVHEPCPAGGPVALPMHDCTPTGCTSFVRWYNPTLGTLIHDRTLAGTAYTPTGTVGSGPCPAPIKSVELVHDVLADGTCVSVELVKTFACDGALTVAYYDLAGAVYSLAGTLSVECPCRKPARIGLVSSWDDVANA
jgi:hypothetical protein